MRSLSSNERSAFLVVVLFMICGASSSLLQPEVTLEQGTLRGKILTSEFKKRDFAAFLGVPYGVPPVGSLRFKESEPAKPWLGVLNASLPGPVCLQYSHFTQFTPFEIHGSEDCLYLNVYTPQIPSNSKENALLDVIVYIHGGAFMFLSGYPWGPEYLLDKDVVLVTLNYRLGPLGFLSTEDEIVPGNNGLKDQLLAIKWVKNNIHKFGGDPNKISLGGTSAGGASVHYHVISPRSKGLFTHGIIQSGTVLNPWPLTENSLEKAQRLSAELGCPTGNTKAMIDCLRTRPADHIVEKTKLFMPWLYNPFTPFGPVVEPSNPTAFIDRQPLELILSKEASDLPLLISYTADEGLYPGSEIIGDPKKFAHLEQNWNDLLPHLLDYNYTVAENRRQEVANKITSFYMDKPEGRTSRASVIKMLGDRLFINGIREAAKLHAQLYKSPTFAYVFGFKGSKRGFMDLATFDGVSHADDLAYVFKRYVPWGPIGSDEESVAMSHYMVDMWMDFIRDKWDSQGWPDVKTTLPAFGYKYVVSGHPEKNQFKVDNSTKTEDFWNSLQLKENLEGHLIRHSEL